MSTGDVADSARLAMSGEADAIAEIQRRGWADRLPADSVALLLDQVQVEAMTAVWQQAISRPPQARLRVLVAVTGSHRVTGFALTGPAEDPDADPATVGTIEEFAIDPPARGRGHGSRLLNACADTLRADGFRRALWWVGAQDDQLRQFLVSAGWAPDGAHREIGTDDGAVRVKQIRLHTDLDQD